MKIFYPPPSIIFSSKENLDDNLRIQEISNREYKLKVRRTSDSLKGASLAVRLAMPVIAEKAVDTVLALDPLEYQDGSHSPGFEGFAKLLSKLLDSQLAHKTRLREFASLAIESLNKEKLASVLEKLEAAEPDSDEYLAASLEAIKPFIDFENLNVKISLQSDDLDNAIKNNEACVFIMNHDNLALDPTMMKIFSYFLYSKYLEAGQNDCPKPKVLTSTGILGSKTETQRKIDELFGSVPVDVSVQGSEKKAMFNGRIMAALMKELTTDKSHLFVFPEGRNSIRRWEPTEKRFQGGITKLIQRVAKKKTLKVFPIGFAVKSKLSEKAKRASIVVGEALSFNHDGDKLLLNGNSLGVKPELNELTSLLAGSLVEAKQSAKQLVA